MTLTEGIALNGKQESRMKNENTKRVMKHLKICRDAVADGLVDGRRDGGGHGSDTGSRTG